jgi:hypothetical protein
MDIKIDWKILTPDSKEWDYYRVLYAYLNPSDAKIVYIGLAFHRTIRQRFKEKDKKPLFDFLRDKHNIYSVDVLMGDLEMDGRLTRQLLSDVESLLIKRVQPIGNIACKNSRISRPGVKLQCYNQWPYERIRFIDR